jgi:hypothetical protein
LQSRLQTYAPTRRRPSSTVNAGRLQADDAFARANNTLNERFSLNRSVLRSIEFFGGSRQPRTVSAHDARAQIKQETGEARQKGGTEDVYEYACSYNSTLFILTNLGFSRRFQSVWRIDRSLDGLRSTPWRQHLKYNSTVRGGGLYRTPPLIHYGWNGSLAHHEPPQWTATRRTRSVQREYARDGWLFLHLYITPQEHEHDCSEDRTML